MRAAFAALCVYTLACREAEERAREAELASLIARADEPLIRSRQALVAEAQTFPAGTSLAPGAFLLVVADKPGAPSTPQTDCLGAASCFHVGFGISGSAGDEVFLLKGTEIHARGAIPASAHAADESWCRFPDGAGDFAKCSATPAAKNQKL